jgi:chromosome segregation ATPase
MTIPEIIALTSTLSVALVKILDLLVKKYKVTNDSKIAEQKIDIEWQKEFNDANAKFREELHCEIKSLRTEVSDLRTDVSNLRKEKLDLEEEVTRLRGKNEALNEEVSRLKTQNTSLGEERRKLELRVQELEKNSGGTKCL